MQDRTKNKCKDCHFYEPVSTEDQHYTGRCHRYPAFVWRDDTDWCGEFICSVEAALACKEAIEAEIAKRIAAREP
jgi:hypothetical protein